MRIVTRVFVNSELLPLKDFNYLDFQSLLWVNLMSWWRLFRKLVVRIELDVYVFIIGVFCLYGLSIYHVLYYSLFLIFNLRVLFGCGIYNISNDEYLYAMYVKNINLKSIILRGDHLSFLFQLFNINISLLYNNWYRLINDSFCFNMPASDWFKYNYNASERIDRRDVWRSTKEGNQKPNVHKVNSL